MKLSLLLRSLQLALILFAAQGAPFAQAGSATWSSNPTSNDWHTAVNWMPQTVPNSPADLARFAGSDITDIKFSAVTTEVAEIVFTPEAGSFNITADSELAQSNVTLIISGAGIVNNSEVTQNLTAGLAVLGKGGTIEFLNGATAGDGTSLTALGETTEGAFDGSEINFHNSSTAGTASFVAEGATGSLDAGGGEINFFDNTTAAEASFTATGSDGGEGGEVNFSGSSTAHNAIFTTEPASNGGFFGGEVNFFDNSTAETAQFTVSGGGLDMTFSGDSTAADATFVLDKGQVTFEGFDFNGTKSTAANGLFNINGGSTSGAFGGTVAFFGGTAGNATLIANSGTNGGEGGQISFFADDESEARIKLFGNATLTVFFYSSGEGVVTVGSIEGDGVISLSTGRKLIIGHNDLTTTFSGTIKDFGSGSLGKTGIGTLTLSRASTYAGGTTVTEGTLLVTNVAGSGTGSGPVSVDGGTLGGSGVIAGAVTVGTGSGTDAFLAPALEPKKQSTLRIQSALTFDADATYTYTFRARGEQARSDKVIANGVTINAGAFFAFQGTAQGALPIGLSFTAIKNTSASPSAGTFSNLPDGAILTVNGNKFQANYEGGDGNDLTLTVVP